VEVLLTVLGRHIGFDTVAYGEVALRNIRARPDHAVDLGESRVGYIELKAPGRGVPPNWKPDKREREQWEKLTALPNLIYTDGLIWQRFSLGEPSGPPARLTNRFSDFIRRPPQQVDSSFERLIREFLYWKPSQPRNLNELIRTTAGLCRLLREEVAAALSSSSDHAAHEDLTLLAEDWRVLLFPDLSDNSFSDAYAQTIVFAMLLARVNSISFENTPLYEIARQLGKKHSLIGKAFAVLTDNETTGEIRIIETLRRVIGAVDWATLDDGNTDIYVELYERFLAEYDPGLRKQSGSYYTPEPVARFMVDFVDDILCVKHSRPWGFAADDVVVVDPAMGSGTFLVEVIRVVAETIDRTQGKAARAAQLRDLFQKRLVGFERQVASHAVAELRLHQALMRFDTEIPNTEIRFLTDALANPRTYQGRMRTGALYKIIERNQSEADRVKGEVPVMVVIGNPPHLEHAKGHAPWIEERRKVGIQSAAIRERPSLDEFRAPGQGRYESDLHALHWYFWRWALWKVFEAHPEYPAGVVALVTPASYLTGNGLAGMREHLRRTCDEGWIIDVSPEGNRSDPETRIFGGVQRGLCIGIFARYGEKNEDLPADIHYTSIAGTRDEKFVKLQSIRASNGTKWTPCGSGWQDPLRPGTSAEWQRFPQLSELMPWTSRGVTTGRAWVYAPSPEILAARWRQLVHASTESRKILFSEARDRKINSRVRPLPGFPKFEHSLADENGELQEPVRVGFRSFDRQWIIPDNRLMAVSRPPLWAVRSERQVYVTEQNSHAIESGPGLTFSAFIPDLHHYNARSGRVLPLYRDPTGDMPNLAPSLCEYLTVRLGLTVSAEDFLAYVAAVVAHTGYTHRFSKELRQPGVRVPLTANPELWRHATDLGRQVLWLHTYGERFKDEQKGRPSHVSVLVERIGPRVLSPISDMPQEMPDRIDYDSNSRILHIGSGVVGPVSPEVWAYDVAGMNVLRKWLDFRRKRPRHKRRTTPLDHVDAERWSPQFTTELLELISVIGECIRLESAQGELLDNVLISPIISVTDLKTAGVLPAPSAASKPPSTEIYETGRLM
jgi:hypothetical protein